MLRPIDGLTSSASLHRSYLRPTEPLRDYDRGKLDTDESSVLLLQTSIFDTFLRPIVWFILALM